MQNTFNDIDYTRIAAQLSSPYEFTPELVGVRFHRRVTSTRGRAGVSPAM